MRPGARRGADWRDSCAAPGIPAGDLLPDTPEPLDSGDIAVLNEEEEMVRAAVAALPGRQSQVMAIAAVIANWRFGTDITA